MAQDATLTPTQRNDVFRAITAVGLAPDSFKWDTEDKREGAAYNRVSVVRHGETGSWFIFGNTKAVFSPGAESNVETGASERWQGKVNELHRWLSRVKVESTAPDLWAAIAGEKALSNAVSSVSIANLHFTPSETKLVAAKLDGIENHLLESQQFSNDQAESIHREFRYLREASERLGRKDWLTILIGGLFALALTLALPPETAKELMRLAGSTFQWLWTGMQLLGE